MLNLHRDTLAVAYARAMDLTEGRDRARLLVEAGKHVLQAGVEVPLDDLPHELWAKVRIVPAFAYVKLDSS